MKYDMEQVMVSVVIPCYNAEKYISKTIESVISQTYTKWELLIVDDCSTDKSARIIDMYVKQDSRIKYYRTKCNTGTPAEPRNIGIINAKGKYVALLDADDLFMPNKLEEQVDFIQEGDKDLIFSNGIMINEEGKYLRNMVKRRIVDYKSTLMQDDLGPSSVMIKRTVLDGVKFRTMPKEDYVFWLELLRKKNIIAYNSNTELYAYRIVHNSRSRNKLKMIKQQWWILRDFENLNLFPASYYLFIYLYKSIKKYYF